MLGTGRSRCVTVMAAVVLATLSLAGCQTTDDPAKGGFFSGVSNLGSGGYDRRIQEKQADLDAAKAERASLEQRKTAVDAERSQVSAEVAAAEARLVDLRLAIDDLSRRIDEAGTQHALNQAEHRRLVDEAEALSQAERLVSADPAADFETKQRRIRELEQRRAILERILTAALGN